MATPRNETRSARRPHQKRDGLYSIWRAHPRTSAQRRVVLDQPRIRECREAPGACPDGLIHDPVTHVVRFDCGAADSCVALVTASLTQAVSLS